MANNVESNVTQKVMKSFLSKFESDRVLSRNVNTQLFQGKFTPDFGDTISVKRATDYNAVRTPEGNVTSETESSIIAGKASAVVQDYFTTFVSYNEADEAIKLGQLDQLLAPMATRLKTDFEVDYAGFMMKNTALLSGTPGVAADSWSDIANFGATLQASGVPGDGQWFSSVNPYTQRRLADTQRAIGAVDPLVSQAFRNATIANDFAGMKVMTSTTLDTYTTGTGADRAGTLSSNPVVTYLGAKDTMTQVLPVTGLQANLVVAAGETIQIVGRNRLNLSTRKPIVDDTGAVIVYTGTVTASVTLNGSGAGNLVVTGPAIFETDGQYNTVASAPVSGDVVNLLGSADTLIQPNLFWHKDAFVIASVPIERLHNTDTFAQTEDGLQFRVSKGSDFLANKQRLRIDFRPAYGVMNPFFAGQGFGSA